MDVTKGTRVIWMAVAGVAALAVVGGAALLATTSRSSSSVAASSSPLVSSSAASASATAASSSGTSTASTTDDATASNSATTSSTQKGPQDSPAASPTATAADGRIAVNVLLTTWGTDNTGLYAGALVQAIVETDGTCTLTATNGTLTKSASATGQATAANTSCAVTIPTSDLSSGTWTITMQYSSTQYVGTTASETVTVG